MQMSKYCDIHVLKCTHKTRSHNTDCAKTSCPFTSCECYSLWQEFVRQIWLSFQPLFATCLYVLLLYTNKMYKLNCLQVQHHKILCIVILSIWTLSLVQFTLVFTATRGRRDKTRLYVVYPNEPKSGTCCHADVFGILISMLLQDLPFLVLRLLLIFHYHVLSYTNMFFTSKNTLVIALLIYRLVVLFLERKRKTDDTDSLDSVQDRPVPDSGVFRRTSEARKSLIAYYEIKNLQALSAKLNGEYRSGEKLSF